MRASETSAIPRLLLALALLLALGWPAMSGAQSPSTRDKPPTLPSGGPAAAHAHPPARTAPGVATKPSQVVIPAVPPAPPMLPPPIEVPTRPPPPATPVPIAEDAPGTASLTEEGLRITFGSERADFNPASAAAVTEFAHAAPSPNATFTVTGYATGGDDPSTPRRLSLSRALAVRSALMEAGIASVRIYVKALGAAAPVVAGAPPDRVDIVMTAGAPPAPQPAVVPAAPSGPRQETTPPGQSPSAPAPTKKADP